MVRCSSSLEPNDPHIDLPAMGEVEFPNNGVIMPFHEDRNDD